MKNKQFAIIVLIAFFFIVSCEGPKIFSVIVIDKVTKVPVDSVFVVVKVKAGEIEKSAYNIQGYTDSAGKFVREEMIGYGLSLRRWDFYMDYDKKGYVHKTELNHTEGLVELER